MKQMFRCPSCGHMREEEVENLTGDTLIDCKYRGICQSKMIVYKSPILELSGPIILGKMTKEQIKAEKKQRSRDHFNSEILPNIPKSTAEGKYFRKRLGKT